MIGSKKRFEILKRDGFVCQYCGKKGPDITLEVDHIIPKSKGGTDDVDNLITCCRECNMGKGKTRLDDSELWKDKIFDWLMQERADIMERKAEFKKELEQDLKLPYNFSGLNYLVMKHTYRKDRLNHFANGGE